MEPVTPSSTRDESLVVTYMTSLLIRLMTILPAKMTIVICFAGDASDEDCEEDGNCERNTTDARGRGVLYFELVVLVLGLVLAVVVLVVMF